MRMFFVGGVRFLAGVVALAVACGGAWADDAGECLRLGGAAVPGHGGR